ncbi:MAG TPA: YihY/virulence factor BrkB family protein [Thermodesulfobacteriota bacterium]|nr:YihY/virulence factor BrkB family protein [Thermodesulfobacteriota bacterium]
MKRTHSTRFKRLKKFLKNFGLLWPALRKFNDDNGFFLSSGITFNILINLIPFIMLLLALVGAYLYNDQEVFNHIHAYFRDVAPALDPKIMKHLMDVIQNRQIVGILGFAGLLWFTTWVFGSLRIALNIVFRVEKSRGILRGIGIDLFMILLAGILLLVSMILSPLVIWLQGYQGQIPLAIGPTIQWILKYLLPFFLTCCMFFLIYEIIPNKRVHIKSALQTALFTSLLWELAKHLFAWYVVHLAQYSIFYGSLSTLVVFVLWVYYSSTILVVGGEFAYFLEEDRQRSTV